MTAVENYTDRDLAYLHVTDDSYTYIESGIAQSWSRKMRSRQQITLTSSSKLCDASWTCVQRQASLSIAVNRRQIGIDIIIIWRVMTTAT